MQVSIRTAAVMLASASLLGLGAVGSAQAALIDRGGGMIYDNVANLTWLSDGNYARTSGFDADGMMTWGTANAWAENLTYGGYTDWRLPLTIQSDGACSFNFGDGNGPFGTGVGNNCTSNEMAKLYAALGGVSPNSVTASGSPALALFTNIMQNINYWTGTTYALDSNVAFVYLMGGGSGGDSQGLQQKSNTFYAWAVRTGDVAPVVVPAPAGVWLLGTGLAALACGRRQARRRSRA